MKLHRLGIVFAIAIACSMDASAATACVQNKTTGLYESRTPTEGGKDECSQYNRPASGDQPAGNNQVTETPEELTLPSVELPATHTSHPAARMSPPAPGASTVALVAHAPKSQLWRISTSDINLRMLITKMAASQVPAWTVIWQVEKDFPIESRDEMTGDFKTAVRYFVSSTEFTDTKAKPCFHSNLLVRIVRQTVVCDPTK